MTEMWGILELMGHVRIAGRITEEDASAASSVASMFRGRGRIRTALIAAAKAS